MHMPKCTTAAGRGQVNLSWAAADNVGHYNVYRGGTLISTRGNVTRYSHRPASIGGLQPALHLTIWHGSLRSMTACLYRSKPHLFYGSADLRDGIDFCHSNSISSGLPSFICIQAHVPGPSGTHDSPAVRAILQAELFVPRAGPFA